MLSMLLLKRRSLISSLGLLLLVDASGHAAQTIFHCKIHGQTVLTDQPCPDSDSASAEAKAIPSMHNPSTVGWWQGQMQYSGSEAGQVMQAAHSVVSLNLEFTADGKVSGISPDNGCHWLGVWAQGGRGLERMITLDLALDHCVFSDLNRHFAGTFMLNAPDSSAQVQLVAFVIPTMGQKARDYRLGGTLRRR